MESIVNAIAGLLNVDSLAAIGAALVAWLMAEASPIRGRWIPFAQIAVAVLVGIVGTVLGMDESTVTHLMGGVIGASLLNNVIKTTPLATTIKRDPATPES